MRKGRTFPAVAALLVALAVPAFSQVGIYLGAFGGTSAQSPSTLTTQFDTDTTFVYGLRAGVRILMIGVELNYFRASHNIIWNGGTIIPSWDQAVNHYSYIGVNGKLYFPLLFLQPFVTLGYGYYTADIHNIDKANEGGFNFGAGLDLRLGRRFSLTAEGRWHKVSVSIQNIDLDLGDFTLWGGLQFHF